ncbi:MAG: class I SAM-dependent methyltransferase [Acidobacteria bacterium]|nr:class I SAM-dependent methyltransferase [Acidobacteriota bacterium]
MTKVYDRAYFDRWYRGRQRVHAEGEVRRKVTLALATAEYFLRRPVRTVLDVGCGEAAWLPHLRALRPRISYLGVDPSDYVVERFGQERNIRKGAFGGLGSLRLKASYDLIVCSDVLHYVPEADIGGGVEEIVQLLEGIAFLEVLTKEDDIMGDLEGLMKRPAAWYRKVFGRAGLVQVGAYSWVGPTLEDSVSALERF